MLYSTFKTLIIPVDIIQTYMKYFFQRYCWFFIPQCALHSIWSVSIETYKSLFKFLINFTLFGQITIIHKILFPDSIQLLKNIKNRFLQLLSYMTGTKFTNMLKTIAHNNLLYKQEDRRNSIVIFKSISKQKTEYPRHKRLAEEYENN